jgi:ABC-2 type transport system permease protein
VTSTLAAEAMKTVHGLVSWVVFLALVLAPAAVSATLVMAARSGNAVAAAQLEPFTRGEPWADLATLVGVIAAVGGLLAFGVYLGWTFGREFTDRTIGALFATPTPLARIATAKLVIYAVLVVVTAVLTATAFLVVGLVMRYPLAGSVVGPLAVKITALILLTGASAVPCAWAATLSRGVLGAVGLAVVLLVLSQVAMFTVGAWFPFAAPGAWAGLAGSGSGEPSLLQLLLTSVTGAAFGALTVAQWHRLRLR